MPENEPSTPQEIPEDAKQLIALVDGILENDQVTKKIAEIRDLRTQLHTAEQQLKDLLYVVVTTPS